MNNSYENTVNTEANTKARIATVLVALLVLLCLFFVSFTTSNKIEDKLEEGVLVNFGTTDFGAGEIQPENISDKSQIEELVEDVKEEVSKPKPAPKSTPSKPVVEKNTSITQKEETVKIPEKKEETKKPEPKPAPTKNTSESKSEPTENTDSKSTETQPQEEAKPSVNQRALYPGSKNTSSSGEGVTGKPGDQGRPDGVPDKGAYEGVNSGKGDKGVGYSLSGRKMIDVPTLSDNSNSEGKITIKIKVDQNGKVIDASLGTPTTISSSSLINKSIEAAKKAKFDKNPNAAEEQFGTMTFIFKVT